MQQLTRILSLCVVLSSLIYLGSHDSSGKQHVEFEAWKRKFNKQYKQLEEVYRLNLYLDNKVEVEEHNRRA